MSALLLTFQSVSGTAAHSHINGFSTAALSAYLGRTTGSDAPLALARGSVLGGSRQHLEVASLVFDAIVKDTLTAGLLGTEEHVFT